MKLVEGLQSQIGLTRAELTQTSRMVELFIRVWLMNTQEVPDAQRDRAAEQGKKRFEKFISELARLP